MPVPAFTDQSGVWLMSVRKHMFAEIMPGKGEITCSWSFIGPAGRAAVVERCSLRMSGVTLLVSEIPVRLGRDQANLQI